MGSGTKRENDLDVTEDYNLFIERTGLLLSQRQVTALGIRTDNIGATFWESSTGMLLDFCKENPMYHVVTIIRPGRIENRYIPRKNIYMLASGDKNPKLVLDMCLKKDPNLFIEGMLEEALAMSCSVDRGHKGE
ncbi:MAG: hypothetical protein HQK54_06550 [Oligoflexales bacterium]|nr:hypothetical protein [Oligoflexales bacterium]